MSSETLVRAWKDEELESPVGGLELSESELDLVAGGGRRRGSLVSCKQFSLVLCVNTFGTICNFASFVIG